MRSAFLSVLLLFALPLYGIADDDFEDTQGTADVDVSGRSEISDEDLRKPPYERSKPNFGIHIAGANQVFRNGQKFPTESTSTTRSVQVAGEWSPLSTEKYGVISVGIQGSYYMYLDSPDSTQTTRPTGFPGYSVGGLARYQFKYFQNQWVVPTAAYRFERFSYRKLNNQFENFNASGTSLGAWFLLNIVDRGSTATLFTETGIRRTYLTAEVLQLSGSGTALSLSGSTYLFGLRFEI